MNELTMFSAHCPHCASKSVQPKHNQPGVYWCPDCKQMDILASELKLEPRTFTTDPHKDPKNKPTVYGHPN